MNIDQGVLYWLGANVRGIFVVTLTQTIPICVQSDIVHADRCQIISKINDFRLKGESSIYQPRDKNKYVSKANRGLLILGTILQ